MSLPKFSIQRPVTVYMFFAAVLLFGFISVQLLRQELFPPVTYPKLSVVTHYANAAPEEIEQLITKPIEEAVGSTPGLRSATSMSREGMSLVVAEFGWEQNMDFAALSVREKIDLVKARLPRDAEEPTVIKFNPFEMPAVTLSVSSDRRNPVQLKRFADKYIKTEMEKINGVASASISGGADEEILVEVDQGRLKASALSINDVSKAITDANLNYPGGTIKENFYEYLVRTIGEFKQIGEIGKIAVGREEPDERQGRQDEDQPTNELVILKDVASVIRQTKERTSYSRFNGRENLTVSIQKQAQANTILVADAVKKKIEKLKEHAPGDIKIDIIYDQSKFIRQAVNGVRDAAVQGGLLAFLVLLIILQNIGASILVITIIPITILATLTLMYFVGISLNVISLGGIALGVGMLVDCAIVVIENIDRCVKERGRSDIGNTIAQATEEVIAPLISSTLTTVMVFLPMIFVTGLAGQIFKELAWVVVVTQLFSLAVAVTLLPVMIRQFTYKEKKEGAGDHPWVIRFNRVIQWCGKPVVWGESWYNWTLPRAVDKKGRFLLIVLGLFVFSIFVLGGLDRVVMPKVDQGQFMIEADLPVGAKVERTNAVSLNIEKYLRRFPEIESVSTIVGASKTGSAKDDIQSIGTHQVQLIVTLQPDRTTTTDELIQKIRSDLQTPFMKKATKGAKITYVLYESSFKAGGESTAPITVDIKGNNLEAMEEITQRIQKKLEQISGVYDVSNSIPESAPETKITVDKDKAAFYRLSVTDLATASHISIKGTVASKFKEEGKEIDIRVVLRESDRGGLYELPFIQMHSPLGINVPLSELVTFKSGEGPSEIKRVGQERTFQIFAKIFKRPLSEVNAEIEAILASEQLPTGYFASLGGENAEVRESFESLRLALILSVILIYMVMAAQFESYFEPFIIMFTIPLSLIGAAAGLWISQTPISVVVLLGVIMLGGIVVNNGIMLIDFVNVGLTQGLSRKEAVIRAGTIRFRPIMMTAMTSVLGSLPLALARDEGSKLQAPMAITIVGGLTVATFLTLVVIPAMYLLSYEAKGWMVRSNKTRVSSDR
ncbi:MAG: efflux RND transporter permease subunit [Candidatus Omnitrophica bacterium]|jgi:HAE1 family hydrophobic/amphiphilic exporter-1|nr:efflux RND transporter permease subunit [Candidatus Omnitrophota bacterium]